MPTRVDAFTSEYPGRSSVLANEVYICEAFKPQSTSVRMPKNAKKFAAIWDTGATGSVITKKVVDDCGLKPIGIVKVSTASGEATTSVYFASVFLPNSVAFPQVRMLEGKIAGDVEVLIGMDIISQGDFAVTNKDGKTVFSFRIPSIERIDFVKQKPPGTIPQTISPAPKVGRNEPCPCGSGKKYKRCCGK
jgi:predicted aspartyl protease